METHSLFNIHQHGFRSKHSCVTQLLEVIEDVMEKIDQGHGIDIAYLDFSKAFDKVPHKRLLHKLKAYNISGTILDWIESFLKDLRFCHRSDGRHGFEKNISSCTVSYTALPMKIDYPFLLF